MKRALALLLLLTASIAIAQDASTLAGDWLITSDIFGYPNYDRLTLKADGGKLTAAVNGTAGEATLTGNQLRVTVKHPNSSDEYVGSLAGTKLSGTYIHIAKGEQPEKFTFTAERMPQRRAGTPQRHEFVPTRFEREFSPRIKPVLNVWPGDTIHTTTVDAGGSDEKGVERVLGGNPETGPFYIETAMPGDVLAVHFTRIRLNRDYAISDDAIVGRAMGPQFAVKMKDLGKNVRWHLDRERGVATTMEPGEHLKNFTVPLRPMLGCVATAPGSFQAPVIAGDSGRWGGNMDFNEINEGVTVYLPVNVPGALLYVGDGHAAQGDGELNGNALETSMEVEFTVDVVPHKSLIGPRVESDTHIMAVGLGGSLEDALHTATASLAQWLEQDYALTPSEIAQVLGTSAEFKIGEVADRNAGIVAKLKKSALANLPKPQPAATSAKP